MPAVLISGKVDLSDSLLADDLVVFKTPFNYLVTLLLLSGVNQGGSSYVNFSSSDSSEGDLYGTDDGGFDSGAKILFNVIFMCARYYYCNYLYSEFVSGAGPFPLHQRDGHYNGVEGYFCTAICDFSPDERAEEASVYGR